MARQLFVNYSGEPKVIGTSAGAGEGPAPPARARQTLPSALAAGAPLAAPPYTAGSGRLFVYMNGLLLEGGADYSETGIAGDKSERITFSSSLPSGTRLSFIIY
jgi:hypothetical protein